MKKAFSKILAVFFTVSVFLFCGFLSIMIPANSSAFYSAQFKKHDTLTYVRSQSVYLSDEKASAYIKNLTSEQLLDLMNHVVRYCMLIEDDMNITVDGEYLEIFQDDEISHMKDVQKVFLGGFIIVAIAIVFIIVGLVFFFIKRKGYYENCRKVPYWTLLAVVGVLLLIALFALINFDLAFEIFHQIFFDGNYSFSSGVMIWMIGFIFEDIVAIIVPVWIILLSAFTIAITFINKKLAKKYEKN